MEASPSPSSSLSSQLRHRLRATVCCCFGQQQGGERMRWRRRSSVGEFRYDPLSYALNFDEGAEDVDVEEEEEEEDAGVYAGRANGLLMYQSFSSRLPTPSPAFEVA
ncbi:hypothetical protein PR202_gb06431 [Eleusine coracana subsp. coracana]|uniref:Uncharacterized protein n=1 Tax=Eleusine coracana subsp. coracana TaxID=191504 RepID=A0AAV5EAH9_ELECO|nr:hypothetical protein QOZ80_2BG0157300 [Eleusine coracana subsp. coracana]GJN19186.1 hypothetical protein PR202_gb06431 [Eleusine coracana subsp. coracana]